MSYLKVHFGMTIIVAPAFDSVCADDGMEAY